MAARTPTDFTRYINDGLVAPRLPIIRTTLDEIVEDQQFAIDCEQLIVSSTMSTVAGGAGVKVGCIFPNLLGKQVGDGLTSTFDAYIVGHILDRADVDNFWVGTRPDHVTAWTYYSLNMAPHTDLIHWVYFGSLIPCFIGGDIFIGYETSAANCGLYRVGVFAVET